MKSWSECIGRLNEEDQIPGLIQHKQLLSIWMGRRKIGELGIWSAAIQEVCPSPWEAENDLWTPCSPKKTFGIAGLETWAGAKIIPEELFCCQPARWHLPPFSPGLGFLCPWFFSCPVLGNIQSGALAGAGLDETPDEGTDFSRVLSWSRCCLRWFSGGLWCLWKIPQLMLQ